MHTESAMIDTLELAGEDFKAAIINTCKILKEQKDIKYKQIGIQDNNGNYKE